MSPDVIATRFVLNPKPQKGECLTIPTESFFGSGFETIRNIRLDGQTAFKLNRVPLFVPEIIRQIKEMEKAPGLSHVKLMSDFYEKGLTPLCLLTPDLIALFPGTLGRHKGNGLHYVPCWRSVTEPGGQRFNLALRTFCVDAITTGLARNILVAQFA